MSVTSMRAIIFAVGVVVGILGASAFWANQVESANRETDAARAMHIADLNRIRDENREMRKIRDEIDDGLMRQVSKLRAENEELKRRRD